MTREELINRSEAYIRQAISERIPSQFKVYLYGSRARGDNRWNSDYDLWIDGEISGKIIRELTENIEESFVPFRVELVTTPQLSGRFMDRVKKEAKPWI